MKALGRSELREARDRATSTLIAPPLPWPTSRVRADILTAGDHSNDFAGPQPAANAGSRDLPPLHGIERRLVRRAEALWRSLCPADGLPPLSALASLLAEPFGSQAVVFRIPHATQANPAPAPVAHGIGIRLKALGNSSGGTRSALMRRLGMLASDALADQRPALYDSETENPGIRASRHGPALMVRAIALPLCPPKGAAASVVVVASWREILSARDTRALQQELTTAIAWMQAHGFTGTA